jgi:hypothetical protein
MIKVRTEHKLPLRLPYAYSLKVVYMQGTEFNVLRSGQRYCRILYVDIVYCHVIEIVLSIVI